MLILGIESSCDETSVALVRDGKEVLALEIASSVFTHAKLGGVVPELAARDHVVKMIPVLEQAMENAGVLVEDVDAIAVTNGPGLVGSLLSGIVTAQTLSYVWKKPLLGVHHIAGHIYANWLERDDEMQFPLLVMTASGGHNELVLMRGHGDFEIIGESLDDAAGEAFDKVGRMLGLGFPGGPAISKAAAAVDHKSPYELPRPMLHSGDYNFSFSGLKTATAELVRDVKGDSEELTEIQQQEIACAFQEATVAVLVSKLIKAAKEFNAKEIHLSGGVSANGRLREILYAESGENGPTIRHPEKMVYCTDNAAMIAGAAFYAPRQGSEQWQDIDLDLSFGF